MEANQLVPSEVLENKIYFIRGQKVMMSRDLALLYDVPLKVFMQAVKRNSERFPDDFMFQLTNQEVTLSRSRIVTLKRGQNIKYLPYAFTEQGVAMLSSVLKSRRAVQVNIEIMRAFVRLRQILSSNKELSKRLDELEKRYDGQFRVVFEAIRKLMSPPPKKSRKIGFERSENRTGTDRISDGTSPVRA